jgi:two-component system sensor histidine kinase MprB
VVAVCVTALLVGLLAYLLVGNDAQSQEDQLLRSMASRPATTLGPRTTEVDLAQLSTGADIVLHRTQALSKLGTLPSLHPGYTNVTLGGEPLRVYTTGIRARYVLSVATSDAPAQASLRRLRRGVLTAMGIGAVLASLMLVWVTRRALAPVRETAAVADQIVNTGDLTARVPTVGGGDEIAQLADSINRMLDHLEASDAALRRLVADASHELRSPVTTLRGNLELLSDGRLTGADQREAIADTRAEADRLGRMVEDLLTLARADTVSPEQTTDMLEIAGDAVHGTGAVLSTPEPPGPLTVNGDPVALRAMVRNLIENAERYGSGAALVVSSDDAHVTVQVIDHGPGIPPAERDAIFGRFSRGSGAAGLPGSGLGLAIVAATARSHGGQVELTETPGGGATFTISLPRASQP